MHTHTHRSDSHFVAVNTKIRCREYSVFGVPGIYEWDIDIRVRSIELRIFGSIYFNAGELAASDKNPPVKPINR